MNIRPLGNRILVEAVQRPRSGLIIELDQYRPDELEWRIVAIGSGRLLKDGTREPIGAEVGWRVISHAYTAKHLEYNGTKLRIIDWPDVLMVLPP